MGASEEVGKVADDTIGALKSAPILLVMVLLNLGFLSAAAWYFHQQQVSMERVLTNIFDRCLPERHPDGPH